MLAAEMTVRGYTDKTPVLRPGGRIRWPSTFITTPGEQYALLGEKYGGRESGRIPLPESAQELWAQHKYSVMARDPEAYRSIGRRVARLRRAAGFSDLAVDLIEVLRLVPPPGRLINALEHMWGYVSASAGPDERRVAEQSAAHRLAVLVTLAMRLPAPYLVASTALSELAVFAGSRRP